MIRFVEELEAEQLLPFGPVAIELARQTLVGLANGSVELPPKLAIHPRSDGFINAMPAYCSGPDLAGVKVIAAYPGNRAKGLAAINGIVVVCSAETGELRGVVSAGALTAARTAAASGACMARLAPKGPIGITGAGVEARAHLRVAVTLGFTQAQVWDHRPSNLEALAAWAQDLPISLRSVSSPAQAAEGAAVVVTGIPIGAQGGRLPLEAVRPDALVLPLDYSTSVGADLANQAALLACDDPGQLEHYRSHGHFSGWRTPDGPVGRWLAEDGPARPHDGMVVVANLGVGAHDIVFASHVLDLLEKRNGGLS